MLSRETLKKLLEIQRKPCVTLYMPVERPGADAAQNPIRLKNLITRARRELEAHELPAGEIEDILKPANRLLEDPLAWGSLGDGLCLLCCPDFFEQVDVPVHFEEQLVVGERFHIKPLVRVLAEDGRFFILALSQNQARFFSGSRFSIQQVEVEGLPAGLKDILKYETYEKNVQFHTGTPAMGGGGERRPAMFFGQSDDEVEHREKVLQYFREVDRGLHDLLRDERHPLVLASVESLMPLYRKANTYPYLLEKGVEGNPDKMNPRDLHAKSWTVVEKYLHAREEAEAKRYRELRGGGRVAEEIEEAVRAAYDKRIDTAFVPVGRKEWGVFDAASHEVKREETQRNGNEDLLNFIAIHTLINGGNVIPVPPERMPVDAPVSASLRF